MARTQANPKKKQPEQLPLPLPPRGVFAGLLARTPYPRYLHLCDRCYPWYFNCLVGATVNAGFFA